MNGFTAPTYAVATLLLALLLGGCFPPQASNYAVQQAALQQQAVGGVGMMGIPFSNAGWQYAGSGFDPAMQPMIAAQQAMNTVYAVSPNGTIAHPMPQPSASAPVAGTAPQAGAPSGYATNAALQAVARRVERNAAEANAEFHRRQRR